MPKLRQKQFEAWSFSRFNDWRTCALRAKLKYLDKLPEGEPGPALARGSAIHKEAEDYVLGNIKKLPDSLATFEEEFNALRKQKRYLRVEQQWGFDSDWEPADWFGKQTWVRVVVDLAKAKGTEVLIIDHKTGKIYPYHEEQLSLYAIAAFMMFPKAKTVDARLWYLDPGIETTADFDRKDLPDLKADWEAKVKPMLADKVFTPNPSAKNCRFCHYKKANGGPCQY